MDKPSTITLYTSATGKLREYAGRLGIDIPDGANRFDIIDLIRLFPGGPTDVEVPQEVLEAQQQTPPGEPLVPLPPPPEIANPSVRIQRLRDQNS